VKSDLPEFCRRPHGKSWRRVGRTFLRFLFSINAIHLPSQHLLLQSVAGNTLKLILLNSSNPIIMDDDQNEPAQPRSDRPNRIPLKAIEKYVNLISRQLITH
jgi:hypothetical protein